MTGVAPRLHFFPERGVWENDGGEDPGEGAELRERADAGIRAANCDSCKEIAAGTSLDVTEIDAASNRALTRSASCVRW